MSFQCSLEICLTCGASNSVVRLEALVPILPSMYHDYSGTPQSGHSEIRTPRYRGQFLPSQILHLRTFQSLKSGHPDNQDTFLVPKVSRLEGFHYYCYLPITLMVRVLLTNPPTLHTIVVPSSSVVTGEMVYVLLAPSPG